MLSGLVTFTEWDGAYGASCELSVEMGYQGVAAPGALREGERVGIWCGETSDPADPWSSL
jgi:hypothetical protein